MEVKNNKRLDERRSSEVTVSLDLTDDHKQEEKFDRFNNRHGRHDEKKR